MIELEGLATEYPKGTWIEPHAHSAHQIVHARSGVMRVTTVDGSWVLPPGRALWVPARCLHEIRCRDAVSMRTVYLSASIDAAPANCVIWQVSPLIREVILRIASDHDPSLDAALLSLLLAEIQAIDVLPLHLPEPSDSNVRSITTALLADPADDRGLDDWASLLGLSPRTLIRRFQSETGMTFRQWRRQARMLAALELLAAGEPVTKVAFDVGYDGLSAFVEAFRQTFGTTPGKYFS